MISRIGSEPNPIHVNQSSPPLNIDLRAGNLTTANKNSPENHSGSDPNTADRGPTPTRQTGVQPQHTFPPLTNQALFFIVLLPIICIAQGVAWPFSAALLTQHTNRNAQGRLLGFYSSIQSLGIALPPLLGGLMVAKSEHLPVIAAIIIISYSSISVCVLFANIRLTKSKLRLSELQSP